MDYGTKDSVYSLSRLSKNGALQGATPIITIFKPISTTIIGHRYVGDFRVIS